MPISDVLAPRPVLQLVADNGARPWADLGISMGTSESGLASAINGRGQFVAASNTEVYLGQGTTTRRLGISMGTSQSGLGAAINDLGNYVVASNTEVYVGQFDDARPSRLGISMGTSESGVSAAMNADGYYIVGSNTDVVVGRGHSFVRLGISSGTSQSGVAVSINDDGRFVFASNTSVVTGSLRAVFAERLAGAEGRRAAAQAQVDGFTRELQSAPERGGLFTRTAAKVRKDLTRASAGVDQANADIASIRALQAPLLARPQQRAQLVDPLAPRGRQGVALRA